MVLLLVRPIFEGDVQLLEIEFSDGYRKGERVLYVSVTKNDGSSLYVTDETVSSWDQHWQRANQWLRRNWIRTNICINLRAKCFMFGRVIIE